MTDRNNKPSFLLDAPFLSVLSGFFSISGIKVDPKTSQNYISSVHQEWGNVKFAPTGAMKALTLSGAAVVKRSRTGHAAEEENACLWLFSAGEAGDAGGSVKT